MKKGDWTGDISTSNGFIHFSPQLGVFEEPFFYVPRFNYNKRVALNGVID